MKEQKGKKMKRKWKGNNINRMAGFYGFLRDSIGNETRSEHDRVHGVFVSVVRDNIA